MIPLQEASYDIWEKKYRLHDSDGNPVDLDQEGSKDRIAHAIAQVEPVKGRKKWEKLFREALDDGAVPAGRIYSNAGAGSHKREVSLVNCTVSATVEDSMDSILRNLYEAGMTLKSGAGIGYEFSSLRPKGAFVHGAGAETSGPISFMEVFDKMCQTIASAGGRRGAQMATFDCTHPDILDFIKAKRTDGCLRQFNLSVLVTDQFMDAVKADADWHLEWDHVVHKTLKARELWDTIMVSTYNFAEPGFLLVDRINRFNNLWFCENIRATNPCGEQPLPPTGACNLGSLNLTKFISDPFTPNASFDFSKFARVVAVFTRMLDNVADISGLPLTSQVDEILYKRRHGMGFFGLGSAMTMLGMRYGDQDSLEFTSKVSRLMAMAGFQTGAELSREKGEAPVLQDRYYVDNIPELNKSFNQNWKKIRSTSDTSGRKLMLLSHYFDEWHDDPELSAITRAISRYGSRFSHATSIAPTGTLALSVGNNCSNGIEPSFAHEYTRNVIREGRNAKEALTVYSYEYLVYKKLVEDGLSHEVSADVSKIMVERGLDPCVPHVDFLPEQFGTTDNIDPYEHIAVQAAAQQWVDSSISKCLAEGTRLLTNRGLMRVEDLGEARVAGEFAPALKGLKVYCPDGKFRRVSAHYYDGFKTTYRVRFDNGLVIEGSKTHKVMTTEGWRSFKDLKEEDVVVCRKNVRLRSKGGSTLPPLLIDRNSKSIRAPSIVTADFCLFVGMLLADGHLDESSGNVSIHKSDKGVVRLAYRLMYELFGIKPSVSYDDRNEVVYVSVNSKPLCRWLRSLCGYRAGYKHVPDQIMRGSEEELSSLLSGVSLDKYRVKNGGDYTVLYDGKSETLATQLFSVCTALSYAPYLGTKYVKSHDYFTYWVRVSGFSSCPQPNKNSGYDTDDWLVQLPDGIRQVVQDPDHPQYGLHKQSPLQKAAKDSVWMAGFEVDPNFYCIKVREITMGKAHLYDIEVEGSHDYVVDGVWSHNTVNVPTSYKFEDFKNLYLAGYEAGLKGMTTFRYNPEAFSGVLVKKADLQNTMYTFVMDDGTEKSFSGDTMIEYEGQTHSASNLFDAIKENYYGRF